MRRKRRKLAIRDNDVSTVNSNSLQRVNNFGLLIEIISKSSEEEAIADGKLVL